MHRWSSVIIETPFQAMHCSGSVPRVNLTHTANFYQKNVSSCAAAACCPFIFIINNAVATEARIVSLASAANLPSAWMNDSIATGGVSIIMYFGSAATFSCTVVNHALTTGLEPCVIGLKNVCTLLSTTERKMIFAKLLQNRLMFSGYPLKQKKQVKIIE